MTVPVLWLYGADSVGKSTVGWAVYERLVGHGVPLAFVDTDYLSFCSPGLPGGPAGLVQSNLGAMWPNFAAAGARALVVAGVVVTRAERERLAAAVPGAAVTWCRLVASEGEIAARITHRRSVEHPRDEPLAEAELTELAAYAERSVHFARRLEEDDFSDLTVATSGRRVDDIATEVVNRVAAVFPGTPGGVT